MNNIDLYAYEKEYALKGYKVIAGLDEAGRGPMAGPLVVGMVVLDENYVIEGLNDSKKLSPKKREQLYSQIIEHAKEVQVAIIDHEEVDKLNVYEASRQGMLRCLSSSKLKIDFALTDAMPLGEAINHLAIIKGDAKSASIAAASIIAKVTRDQLMIEIDKLYPEYNFKKHKGYVTKEHLAKIKEFGICEEHRLTFSPVKAVLRNNR